MLVLEITMVMVVVGVIIIICTGIISAIRDFFEEKRHQRELEIIDNAAEATEKIIELWDEHEVEFYSFNTLDGPKEYFEEDPGEEAEEE
jgi:hypothetical protein